MVLNLHGQALVRRSSRRAFGHGPAFENTVQLKAQIVMDVRGSMLLHDENQLLPPAMCNRARLRRFPEMAFLAIVSQRHALSLDANSSAGNFPRFFGKLAVAIAGSRQRRSTMAEGNRRSSR